jgi:hypothetical protein
MASQLPSSGLPLSSSSTRKSYLSFLILPSKHDRLQYIDRLPSISASEALRQLRDSGSRTIPTGLDELDVKLAGSGISSYGRGGIVRGQLTEIFGPPGCGKTALAYGIFGPCRTVPNYARLQIAAHSLREDSHIVWIGMFSQLCAYHKLRSL